MPATHRRKDDPEGTEYVHIRGSQSGDKVLRWGFSIEKYFRLAWPIIVVFAGWFMATVWKPIRSIPDLHSTVEHLVEQSALAAKIDSVSIQDRADLRRGQQITNKILCFNMDRSDRVKYGIDCNDIPLPESK